MAGAQAMLQFPISLNSGRAQGAFVAIVTSSATSAIEIKLPAHDKSLYGEVKCARPSCPGAVANGAVKLSDSSATEIKPLCVPFSNSTGTWAINNNTDAGCVDLERSQLDANYKKLVCTSNVPDDADFNNPSFQVCAHSEELSPGCP
jgi:hypothetical protein